nr:hypothetical protein [Tanacetum cinerariifolium]
MSHEGYQNTIELPKGNNVMPLRSDTIRLVQNGCSFHGLRSEDPNQHLKDFLKPVDSLDLGVTNKDMMREGLLNSKMTSWCFNNIKVNLSLKHGLISRTYSKISLIMASIWLHIQIFYDYVSFHLKHEIDRAAGGKLRDKNAT